jgi:hypothetical protein
MAEKTGVGWIIAHPGVLRNDPPGERHEFGTGLQVTFSARLSHKKPVNSMSFSKCQLQL